MSRRSRFRTLLLAAAALVPAAACTDESPTLGGDEFFPGGTRPVTLETVVPAAGFFELLGAFTGYARPQDARGFYYLAANDYAGELDANSLLRFQPRPANVSYVQGGNSRTTPEYTFSTGRLVLRVDSLATPSAGPVTLQLYRLTQGYDPETVTWELAVDSTGERTAFTQPGGTRGALLGQATYTAAAAGDSVVIALDSLEVASLADSASLGAVLTAAESGARVQFSSLVLRTGVHPSNASPDTVIAQDLALNAGASVVVFTPEPPQPAGVLQAGGIRGARTLFRLDLDQRVPGCAPATTPPCATVPLSQVSLNRVSLLLKPVPLGGGFAVVDSLPLSVRSVGEPELGRLAPLGEPVIDRPTALDAPLAWQAPGDTLVEVPITVLAGRVARGDTIPDTFALLSEPSAATFGLGVFEAAPRLRIVYTLPVRAPLP